MEMELLEKLFRDDVEKYEILPQENKISKRKINSQILNFLQNRGELNEVSLKEAIAYAKFKNLDILKGAVEICEEDKKIILSPILACAYYFFRDDYYRNDNIIKMLKYLLVNGDVGKHKDEIKIVFNYLFKSTYIAYNGKKTHNFLDNGLVLCSENFKEIFNIFLGLGADPKEMIEPLSKHKDFCRKCTKNFLEMLISLKNDEINKFLCDSYFYADDYLFLIDLLQKHNINNFDCAKAIKLISDNREDPQSAIYRVLSLMYKGALCPQDFSEENINKYKGDVRFFNTNEEKQFYKIFSDMLKQFEKIKKEDKKYQTKKGIAHSLKKANNIKKIEQELDKIFAEAQKNVEMER